MLSDTQRANIAKLLAEGNTAGADRMSRLYEAGNRYREQKAAEKEKGNAEQQPGAGAVDGGGGAQPGVRAKGRRAPIRRQGVQSGGYRQEPQEAPRARQEEGLTCPKHGHALTATQLTPGGWYCAACWDEFVQSDIRAGNLRNYQRMMMIGAEDMAKMILDESPELLKHQELTPSHRIRLGRIAQGCMAYRKALGTR